MNGQTFGVVVVGAGLCAGNVVQRLREDGYGESILLIGDEGERPYERPPLSKGYLQGQAPLSDAYVHEPDWYDEHQVETRLADPALSIDREHRQISLQSGDTVGYGQLVLAMGAGSRRLPIPGLDLAGVHLLRKIPDSNALRDALQAGGRCVIIGAGWIGLEVAAAARGYGCDVTIVEYADVPLGRVLGNQVGSYFAELHQRNGVTLNTGVSVNAVVGSAGRVSGVQTDRGLFPADVVLVAVGAAPNISLAEAAGLKIDNGIVVDELLRTEDQTVLAAGDLANAFNTTLGRQLRVEHWDNAIRQGRLAAATILGQDERYDWQPYFFTDQYDLGMEYVGYSSADDDVTIRGDQASGEFIVFWTRDGAITAAMNVNIWDVNDDLRALIGRRIPPQRLQDSDIPLTEL